MKRLYFSLRISPEEYLAYYQGTGNVVLTRTEDGKKLQFPAKELRKFVSRSGIQGRFEITLNDEHKLVELRRAEY